MKLVKIILRGYSVCKNRGEKKSNKNRKISNIIETQWYTNHLPVEILTVKNLTVHLSQRSTGYLFKPDKKKKFFFGVLKNRYRLYKRYLK